jgi:hypothetical protein
MIFTILKYGLIRNEMFVFADILSQLNFDGHSASLRLDDDD